MRALMFVFVLSACSLEVDHNVKFDVGVTTECITCLPVCSAAGYFCHDAEGRECEGCNVGCIAGRALLCAADGPHCVQDFVGDEQTVPTICLNRESLE